MYDIFIQAGQSNAEGYGVGPVTHEYVPKDDILYLLPDLSVVRADERTGDDGKIGDFSLLFADAYKQAGLLQPDRKLLIVRAAVGGTGFHTRRWGLKDDLYLKMLEMTDKALIEPGSRIAGLLWHQGECDAFEGAPADEYDKNLTAFVRSVRARYGQMPFIAGDFVNEWKTANIGICAPIVDVIRRVVDRNGPAAFVETSDLKSNNLQTGNGDTIHFCRESLHILGRRYFDAYYRLTANEKEIRNGL